MMHRLVAGNQVKNLSFLHSFQRLLPFSTSTTTTVSDSFANYLVNSLGFSYQQALSASSKLSQHRKVNHFKFEANANSVLTFFRTHGFDDTHIAKMASLCPRLLTYNVDNTLSPKFKFLQHQGFSDSDLTQLISVNPTLLTVSVDISISPTLEILRQVLGCDTLVVAFLKRLSPRGYRGIIKHMMLNVDLLTTYGISIDTIRKHVLLFPLIFSIIPEKIEETIIRVENELGIPRESPMCLHGVSLLFGFRKETIESKCRMFKSFGWTQSDVHTLMMKNPSCFHFSDATIKKKLGFLMGELRLKPTYLTSHTPFFTCSLEKRIMPRYNVWLILKKKGLLKKNVSLYSAIHRTESRFLDTFVIPFKHVRQVYAKHIDGSMKTLTQQKATGLQ